MGRKSKPSDYAVERKLRAYRNFVLEEKQLQPLLERMAHATEVLPELESKREDLRQKLLTLYNARDEIMEILSKLPDAERRLMTAYYTEGLSWEDAAEYYPCSRRWVFANKDRILRDLDRMVRKEG